MTYCLQKKGLILLASLWLMANSLHAALPTTITCQNNTGLSIWLTGKGNRQFALRCSKLKMGYADFGVWWSIVSKKEVNGLAVMVGPDRGHLTPLFTTTLALTITSTQFSLPRKGQEAIFQGKQFIFDMYQRDKTATFRLVVLPLTNKGAKNQ